MVSSPMVASQEYRRPHAAAQAADVFFAALLWRASLENSVNNASWHRLTNRKNALSCKGLLQTEQRRRRSGVDSAPLRWPLSPTRPSWKSPSILSLLGMGGVAFLVTRLPNKPDRPGFHYLLAGCLALLAASAGAALIHRFLASDSLAFHFGRCASS
jgi:hypothetical protein